MHLLHEHTIKILFPTLLYEDKFQGNTSRLPNVYLKAVHLEQQQTFRDLQGLPTKGNNTFQTPV
jgi:hypothetical protein